MRKRGIFTIITTILLFLSLVVSNNITAYANANVQKQIKETQKKQQQLKNERSSVIQEEKNKKNQINTIQRQQADLDKEIKRLDMAVSDTQSKIRQKETDIGKTKNEITNLKQEIDELVKRIDERDNLLKERARTVQQDGGNISYLDVLLGAKSFGDFLNRVDAVTVIVSQDKTILKKHIEEKTLVEEKKVDVEKKLSNLNIQKSDLQSLQKTFISQKSEKDQVMEQLEVKENELEEELLSLQEQEDIIAKQQTMMKRLLQQLQDQLNSGNKDTPVADGKFMRPSKGPVTSEFGQRWGRLHAGIDIGKRGDSVPVVAVESGIVFRSYYSSSYGNCVFVTHSVDGQVFTTVYAHLENRSVSEGDVVKKGQMLGYMGNTGRSFGAHLHFEIHKGAWNAEKSNAVNPRNYISF